MTDQTPEARLAAALLATKVLQWSAWEKAAGDEEYRMMAADEFAKTILAADPTLICPDPDAHEEHVEPPSEAIWRDLPQSRQEGFWFTVDSLAAALRGAYWDELTPNERRGMAAAIIQAAKHDAQHRNATDPDNGMDGETLCDCGTVDCAKAALDTVTVGHVPPFDTIDKGERP